MTYFFCDQLPTLGKNQDIKQESFININKDSLSGLVSTFKSTGKKLDVDIPGEILLHTKTQRSQSQWYPL